MHSYSVVYNLYRLLVQSHIIIYVASYTVNKITETSAWEFQNFCQSQPQQNQDYWEDIFLPKNIINCKQHVRMGFYTYNQEYIIL